MMPDTLSSRRFVSAFVACVVFVSLVSGATFAMAVMEPDDSIPGISQSLPFSLLGSLTFYVGEEEVGDVGDISSVWLTAGDTLRVVMRGQTGTLFHVDLLQPGTPSVYDSPDNILATSQTIGGDATQQYLGYKAPVSGTYYIYVWMQEDSPNGNYALHAKRTRLYSIGRPSVPSYVKRGKRFNLSGKITPGYLFDGKPVTVQLQKRVNGRWSTKSTYNLKYRTAPFGSDDLAVYMRGCKYGASARLSAGRWRTRASIGDAPMKRRYSSWRSFTVH